ncbi:hypothetical protein DICPUDRAFT_151668 [Dictyostelium purpureum]|uniref:PLAC8 family protein n=1 Tax=Dictyostelium purpureum TaxID=5786 RepID=F0ZJG3_DICPU|nr:uncharacterized protein DICPUDRAFT_151668 [Dictyostelium purpureum]EGC35915.1 hypothetical protein DICPUDRAFT_151668 [Dictyostelium purpureum]|eukprot:XP_003287569.1 hypothetical protein DICPUDRAFT_151668 [Dictyostelium purpureum]
MSDSEWSPGLFGCLNDDQFCSNTCCASFLFPQAQLLYQTRAMAMNKKLTTTDFLCTMFCPTFMICVVRSEIRMRYNFDKVSGSCLHDCCAACYCAPCAIHQNSLVIDRNGDKPGGLFMEYDGPSNQNTDINNVFNKKTEEE